MTLSKSLLIEEVDLFFSSKKVYSIISFISIIQILDLLKVCLLFLYISHTYCPFCARFWKIFSPKFLFTYLEFIIMLSVSLIFYCFLNMSTIVFLISENSSLLINAFHHRKTLFYSAKIFELPLMSPHPPKWLLVYLGLYLLWYWFPSDGWWTIYSYWRRDFIDSTGSSWEFLLQVENLFALFVRIGCRLWVEAYVSGEQAGRVRIPATGQGYLEQLNAIPSQYEMAFLFTLWLFHKVFFDYLFFHLLGLPQTYQKVCGKTELKDKFWCKKNEKSCRVFS